MNKTTPYMTITTNNCDYQIQFLKVSNKRSFHLKKKKCLSGTEGNSRRRSAKLAESSFAKKNPCEKTFWFIVWKRADLYHIKLGIMKVVVILLIIQYLKRYFTGNNGY